MLVGFAKTLIPTPSTEITSRLMQVQPTLSAGWHWMHVPKARLEPTGKWQRVGYVRNWSFSNTAETIDTSTMGDVYRTKLGGLKSVTGQAQLMYYTEQQSGNNSVDSPVGDLLDAFRYQDSETVTGDLRVMFRLQNSFDANRDWEMPVLITSWSMACAVGEVVTVDVTFEAMDNPLRSEPRDLIDDNLSWFGWAR